MINRLDAKFERHSISMKPSKEISALEADPVRYITEADCRSTQVKHGLDSLPPEVRRNLLSILDVSQLKAVVYASPTFHQQYTFDRKYLLSTCLVRTLGSVTVDAYAVHLSAALGNDKKQSKVDFIKTYGGITSRQRLSLVDKLAQEDVISMTSFYLRYVKTLAEHHARWMLANLDEAREAASGAHSSQQLVALTRTETMRVTRAIYRFQLLCHLAGPSGNPLWPYQGHRDDIVQTFLDTLEPWEVEELFSFYQFAENVYDKVFKDIRWDLHPDNPKFNDQERIPTPDGAFDLDGYNRGEYLEGTTLRGLPLLHTILFKVKGREQLVSTMQQHIATSYIPFNALEGVLGETQQALRRESHASEHEQMQNIPFPFRGDDEPDAPPLAWTMIWGATYSDLYGWYISDEMRRWGYVFWDAETLKRTGAKKLLMRQWEEYWDDDPRDNLS